jgi:hypothetical protein
MKYRTKNVQRRQKSTVVASALLLILGTSYISANAISQSDKEMAIVKQQLEQPVQPSEPTGTQTAGLWVTGDSVILGIHYELDARSPIAIINARVGRQAPELIEVMKADKANAVDSTVIFNMGNNNKLTSDQVLAVFEEVKNQPRIIVVNTAVPRGWRDENNALIAQYAAWASISMGHPEYFAPDGVHLVPAGVRAYVDAITATL